MTHNISTRTRSPLIYNEWVMLMNVHQYMNGSGPFHTCNTKLNARKHLALATSVGVQVAQQAIHMVNENIVSSERSGTRLKGRRKHDLSGDTDLYGIICGIVLAANKEGNPVHSRLIAEELAKRNIVIPDRTLCCYLRRDVGLCYGKGNRRNILHDSQNNIDYRNLYLERRFNNLNSKRLPIAAEVFLDESYCHLDHHAQCTWLPKNGIVN